MTAFPRPGDTKYDVLAAIHAWNKENPKPPSLDEVKVAVGLGTRSAAQYHVDDLVELKLLARIYRKSRTLVLTPRGKKLLSIFEDDGSADS